jgi:hypothetical protein
MDIGNSYELRLLDKTLLVFSLSKGSRGLGYKAEIASASGERGLFPVGMDVTEVGILKWLGTRVVPKNRKHVDKILKALGLENNDVKAVIDVCKGLSLTDSYWVVPQGFEGRFADYNLFENRFSEALALVAYMGELQDLGRFTTSPELTTDGMLPKAWRFMGKNDIYLYKGSTSGGANTGKEAYCEHYAWQIAKAMGVGAVQYELEEWKGLLASKCKLFTDVDTSFVAAWRAMPLGEQMNELGDVLDCYDGFGGQFSEAAADMLVFDALVFNEDRHLGNFGLLRNNGTGEIIAPAPLFDHGNALFHFAMPEDYADLDGYARSRRPFHNNHTFEDICQAVITDRQRSMLENVFDFSFVRHEKHNLPEEHLLAIEVFIRKRAKELAGKPKAMLAAQSAADKTDSYEKLHEHDADLEGWPDEDEDGENGAKDSNKQETSVSDGWGDAEQ